MRVKRANTLLVQMENDQFVFHHYLSQRTFSASPTALEILRRLHAWTDLETLFSMLPGYSRESVRRSLEQLSELGAVVVEHSDSASLDDDFARTWLWGPLAAAYHFGARDGVFITADETASLLHQQMKFVPSPALFQTNSTPASDISLPVKADYPEPFLTMARRRTNRLMRDQPVDLAVIADCLLFSMAITAMIDDPEVMDLPLKMTPSGGARNPYEAFVCARNVGGLNPGTYHYSALERTLGVVSRDPPPAFPAMLGNQDWAASAAAVIFLVANFDRPMWKYHHSSAYRVTIIEAGHIAQNMILVATHYGIAANPTAAIAQDLAEETLGVGGVTQSVVYSVVLGVPDPDAAAGGAA